MAEKVVFNIAGAIVKSVVGSQAAEEARLFCCVKKEVEKLKDTVSAIRAVLLDAEEKQAKNHTVRDWLGKLSDIFYDADDLLDALSTEALQRKLMTHDEMGNKVCLFFSLSTNQLVHDLIMAHKIKGIRENLAAIKADMTSFRFVDRLVEAPVQVRSDDSYSYVEEDDVRGWDRARDDVIMSLMATNIEGEVSILSIVGIGGIGKTTVAKLVFKDDGMQFDLNMWACVSDCLNLRVLVRKILESAKYYPKADASLDLLIADLREKIGENKYFLVLDDLCIEDRDTWLEFKSLMKGAPGSKILITTRSRKVVEIDHEVHQYILHGLDDEASWHLFRKMAFRNGQELENPTMVNLKELVKRCAGVPLVVRNLGNMLYLNDLENWLALIDSELSKLSQSIENGIFFTLKLTYDKFSTHLKHCFAYCGLFPKGHKFNKSEVINLWIAQGFVELHDNQCLEDIGNVYFKELVSRLFFQPDPFYSKFSFKMHDIIHELAISMAGSLITSAFGNQRGNLTHKTRHISVSEENNLSSLYEARKLRTFICFKGEMDFEKIILSFELLRTLILRDCDVKCVPSNINKLKHLRYLDLSYNGKIKELPNSISELINLQTLIISGCKGLKEFPRDINKLVNLRHLYNDDCKLHHMPRGLSQLTNLQTLKTFVVSLNSPSSHNAKLDELSGLNNLRGELIIHDSSNRVKGTASTAKGSGVESILNILTLEGITNGDSSVTSDHMSLQGSRHLNYLSSLTSLVDLTVSDVKECQHLPPLHRLPSLKKLELYKMVDLEYILGYDDRTDFSPSSVSEIYFPSLKQLCISFCPKLKGWSWKDSLEEADEDRDNSMVEQRLLPMFSCLLQLSVSECPILSSMPIFPHVEDHLSMEGASWKPLQQTLAASSFTPLSKLKRLELFAVTDLEILEGLENLISLKFLKIAHCDEFMSLGQGLQHLTALHNLSLVDCPNFELANDKDGVQWQGLTSLVSITFQKLPRLVSPPLGLHHVTTLKDLSISFCERLTTLPEWICNCDSLVWLRILGCSNFTSLPEGVDRLITRECLTIDDCPITLESWRGTQM